MTGWEVEQGEVMNHETEKNVEKVKKKPDEKVLAFVGHRNVDRNFISETILMIKNAIREKISEGFNTFISIQDVTGQGINAPSCNLFKAALMELPGNLRVSFLGIAAANSSRFRGQLGELVDACDELLALPEEDSLPGGNTFWAIGYAKRLGKPVTILKEIK
jgi:hypothetical protein